MIEILFGGTIAIIFVVCFTKDLVNGRFTRNNRIYPNNHNNRNDDETCSVISDSSIYVIN